MIARYFPSKDTLYILTLALSYILLLAIHSAILRFIPIFHDEKGKLNIIGSVAAFILSLISFIGLVKIFT